MPARCRLRLSSVALEVFLARFWFRTLGSLELRTGEDQEVTGVVASGKLVALLAYLAVATPRGLHRRDSIVGLLWPELNQERARAALRHSLYRLRGFLGAGAIVSRGDEDVGLDFSIIECDAAQFDALLDQGQDEQALILYEGDLLPGFFVRGAPEFERWLDGERTRIRTRASTAACKLAEMLAGSGQPDGAARWGKRALEIAPDDEQILRRVLLLLERLGDRSGALHEYDAFARRLADDYDAKPAPETNAIAARLKQPATDAVVPPAQLEPIADSDRKVPVTSDLAMTATPSRLGTSRRVRVSVIAAAAAALALAGYGYSRTVADDSTPGSMIAVMPFDVRGSPEVQYLREGMTDLLSIDVDGTGGLQAADPRAILSIVRKRNGNVDEAGAREVARMTGAAYYITGAVVEAGGRITLSASLHDSKGRVQSFARTRNAPTAELFELVDDLARQLITGANAGTQELTSLAGRTTRSIPALRAYLEGERELRGGRHTAAVDAFRQATEEDSTFALAWYRLASAGRWTTEYDVAEDAALRALRFGSQLPPYAQRLVEAANAMREGNYSRSESLYVKSTRSRAGDAETWFGLGDLHYHFNALRGRSKAEARSSFERALALDPGDGESRVHLLELAAWEGKVEEVDSLLTGLPAGSDFAAKWPLIRSLIVGDRRLEEQTTASLRGSPDRSVVRVVIHSTSAFPSNLAGASRVVSLLTDPARSGPWRAYGYHLRSQIELARGRWSSARRDLTSMAALEPAAAIEYGALLTLSPGARATASDVAALRQALAGWHAAPTPPSANVVFGMHNGKHELLRLYLLGLVSARLGDTLAAARYADSLTASQGDSNQTLIARNLARAIRARVIYARGDAVAALAELGEPWLDPRTHRTHYSSLLAQVADRYLMAELLEKTGRLGEAVQAYSAVGDYTTDGLIYLPMSHLRRGNIYVLMGDRVKAAQHYARFVELWKDCDPNLRPLRDAAQRRVAQLEGGG